MATAIDRLELAIVSQIDIPVAMFHAVVGRLLSQEDLLLTTEGLLTLPLTAQIPLRA